MDIPARRLYEVLIRNGVRRLYHANSVLNACHFLQTGALLSRGTIKNRGLKQTSQDSDSIDRRYSVWFDVFADSVDIHHRARRQNFYGPVLFEIDVSILKKSYTGNVWVTRRNPMYWPDIPRNERWFKTGGELDEEFVVGEFGQMIVFRHCGGELPIADFLRKIVLDDPAMETDEGIDLFSIGFGALQFALTRAGLKVPIEKRICRPRCTCKEDYDARPERTYELFVPEI